MYFPTVCLVSADNGEVFDGKLIIRALFNINYWGTIMKNVWICLTAIILSSTFVYSQAGGSGAPFLVRNSSPSITAVGGAGVALPVNDAASLMYNPANLGMNIRSNNFLISYNASESASFQDHVIPYDNFAVNFGYNLDSLLNIPIYGGIAYTHRGVDLGTFTRTAENGQVIGKFDSREWSNELSIAASFKYYAVISFGLTYKMIASELTPIDPASSQNTGKANAFDFGFTAKIPVIKNYEIMNNIDADLDFSLGAALLNYGGDLSNGNDSDPLPRQNSLGYSLSLGFDYNKNNFSIKALNIDFSAAAISELLRRDSLNWEFAGMYSSMNVFDNLFAFNNSTFTKSFRGIRLTLLDFLKISFGWGYLFGDNTNTDGFEISSKGISKYLYYLDENDFYKYLNEHLELTFTTARVKYPNHDYETVSDDRYETYYGFNLMYRL